ncbi:RagB/SusD family nutrient uptake outer membrane protein [Dyadobacter jiangsuensis]|uniref:Putative outer membrane starch-binding protein n=1 Tax=Dyadobacter jiangsuensis TaxID=1591085 RepID=A0A2P8FAQ1_9BACT|nr:RagB/SusD family nutrient uptake outer membrane protein [Dyadobacter jiangsuensis]PSL18801.1 putative outer membrane starch-binding protein [Dyadobacter jiangsuensis]
MTRIIKNTLFAIALLTGATSCEDFLKEKVYTEYDPSAFLKDKSGLDALLTGAYARSRIIAYDSRNYTFLFNEFNTDVSWETGGGLEAQAVPFIQFNWPANETLLNSFWVKMYQAIASANSVLDVASDLQGVDPATVDLARAEARFIRASSYYFLLNLFGPTPIIEIPRNAAPEEIERIGKETPRPANDVFVNYLIADLEFAADKLPVAEEPIGRASKGAALGVLTKLYLHEKNWQKVAETAQKVIDLNYYSLYADYPAMFSVQGEANKEYIYRAPCIAQSGYQNNYMPHAFPPNYPIQSNWVNFGAQFRTYTSFYKTFEEGDLRRKLLVTNYTDLSGKQVELLQDATGKALDNVRSFKYVPDPHAVGENNGNDIVYVRYADILLSLAEALNEIDGPTQKALDLVNQVRKRAAATEVKLADFTGKAALRDFLLAERGREFYSEGLRREDLIRHEKFISGGKARGWNAQPHQVLYPIPQQQRDANKNLEQNPGYQ